MSYGQPDIVPKSSGPPDVREKDQYFDVSTIKYKSDSHICILTLERSFEFGITSNVAALCLPDIKNPQSTWFQGTVLGLGYNKGFQDEVKTWTTNGRMEERTMQKHLFNIVNSTKCKALGDPNYSQWPLSRKWVDHDNDQTTPDVMEYFWLQ